MSVDDFGLTLFDGLAGSNEEKEQEQRTVHENEQQGDAIGGIYVAPVVHFDLPEEEDDEEMKNEFSMSDIRDGVVSFRTNQHYVRDCFKFLEYCHNKAASGIRPFDIFFTSHGHSILSDTLCQNE